MIIRNVDTNPSQANPDINLKGVQFEMNPGAEYGEHITNTSAMCNSSAIHTYGNVIAIMEKFLCSEVFPPDTFKTILTSTTLASRQARHLPNQMLKKELPLMVLSPRIVFGQGEDRFMGGTLLNSRPNNTHSFYGLGQLIPLAQDLPKRIWIHGHYNRAVMYIDVILNFNTYSEQQNWLSYLYNMTPINTWQTIRTPLELYIPENFCNLLSKVANVPLRNKENNSVYKFLTYYNSISYHPITYKLNGGSNTDDFFLYYLTDLDYFIQEPQYDKGIKDGQIRRNFGITFTIRCDFNTIGYFTLNAPKITKPLKLVNKEYDTIVPLLSDYIDLNNYNLPFGWTILSWPIFKLEYGKNSISIDNVLNDSLRATIDYHLEHGIPMEKFIMIQFRENGEIVTDELYYIDWKERMLVLGNPNVRKTYRLIISVSIDYINNLIKELYNLE